MHAPAASSRPLPKRTRSTAGLEDIDAWIGQIASSTTSASASTTSTSHAVAQQPPQPRKRHHSLPTASLHRLPATASKPGMAASVGRAFDDTTHVRTLPSAQDLRPELCVFTVQPSQRQQRGFSTSSSRRFSNQHSPSLYEPHTNALSTSAAAAAAVAATLQPPEMSPREDFLVRAFISDAMKLEADNLHAPLRLSDLDHSTHDAYAAPSPTATSTNQQQQQPPAATPSHGHHKWSREEDAKLRETVTRFGGKSWKLIAETLGNGRTDVQCLHRWNKVLKPGLVKGPWTPEEDRVLLNLIARYGVGQIRWCDVALHLPGRIGKQCRERWCNHLDSSIRKGQWTSEEDDTVFRLQQQLGNKWSEIAKKLPGRTENAVKNRFNSAARRKWLVSQAALTGSSTLSTPRQEEYEPASHQHSASPRRVATRPTTIQTAPCTGRSAMGSARLGPPLLSAGLLSGPPRPPPPLPFRGVSLETVGSRGEPCYPSGGLLSFVDDYQHPSPLAFGSSNQLPVAYHSSSSNNNNNSFSLSDARPSFSFATYCGFHPPHDLSSPALVRTQFLQSATNSPSLASLRALLSSPPPPKREDPQDDPCPQRRCRDSELLGDTLQVKQEPIGGHADKHNRDNVNGSNQDTEAEATATTLPVASQQVSGGVLEACKRRQREPQTDACDAQEQDNLDEDDDPLRSIDIPDSDADGEHDGAGSSPVMDDQNMNTFLDSVALELDDMI